MPTIKLQNDKVVLKDGKVSCECCCVVDLDKFKTITFDDCNKSFGVTCGRCGPPPTEWPYANYEICPEKDPETGRCLKWPTLPCADSAMNASGILGTELPARPVAGRYFRFKTCQRYYYRIVNESDSEGGTVFQEGQLGSAVRPLKSGIELWLPYRENKPNLFEGESCGLYIYVFSFMGWVSDCTTNEYWKDKGGSMFNNATPRECIRVPRVYMVDSFSIIQHGPYNEWDPKCPD